MKYYVIYNFSEILFSSKLSRKEFIKKLKEFNSKYANINSREFSDKKAYESFLSSFYTISLE